MSTAQRIIKYLAIAFAIFIIISIVSAIVFGLHGFASIIGLRKESSNKPELKQDIENIATNIEKSDIKRIKIDIEYTNLRIKTGETFNVESNSKNISCKQNNNQIIIEEKNHRLFSFNENISELVVTIPQDIVLDNTNIETGAGEVYIENLATRNFEFDIGAGKVQIDKLTVLENAKVDGGAGKVDILSGEINNLDLDMGAGKFAITSTLTGRNRIDQGAGKLEINLEDNIENYSIKASRGIGSITINGKEIVDEKIYGNGNSYIRVDGGIGAIEIKSK